MTAQEKRAAPATVFVADDHPVFKAGIIRLLKEAGLNVVGDAEDGRTALRQIKRLKPTVAVLDVQMPDLDGIRILEALRVDKFETQVVLLSGYFDSVIVYEAITCGVAALVTKTSGFEYIIKAVIAATRGETTISEELIGGFAKEARIRSEGIDQKLSPREIAVLHLMAQGKNRKEMAKALGISQETVKYHSRNMYSKLRVSNASAAVAEAMRRGLLE